MSLSDAFITVLPDMSRFAPTVDSHLARTNPKGAKGLGQRLGQQTSAGYSMGLKGLAAVAASTFGAIKISQFIGTTVSSAIDESREAAKVGRLTDQVIKTTGGSARVTAKDVAALAESLSTKVGIDDEVIQASENMLLTFKNVRNEVGKNNDIFTRTTTLSLDMSQALGLALPNATKVLGKALNDPIKGMTALSRVGVTFTDEQKEQIKTLVESGKTMEAQKIILAALEGRFKGAAAAAADPADKAGVAWENFKEKLGNIVLPVLNKVSDWFTVTALPAVEGFASDIAPTVQAIVDTLGDMKDAFMFGDEWQSQSGWESLAQMVRDLWDILWGFGEFLKDHPKLIWGTVAAYVAWHTALVALTLAQKGMSIVMGIASAATAVHTAMTAVATSTLGTFLGVKAIEAGTWIASTARTVAHTVALVAYNVVMGAVKVATWAWTAAQWLLNAALDANPIGLIIIAIAALVAGIIYAYKNSETFRNIVNAAWKSFAAIVSWAWNTVLKPTFDKIKVAFKAIGDAVRFLWQKVMLPVFSFITRAWMAVVGALLNGAATAFGWIPGLGPKLKGAAKKFNEFRDDVNKSLEGMKDKQLNVGVTFKAGSRMAYDLRHQGFEVGGLVPMLAGAIPHKDSVNAMLVPGEYVIREDGSNLVDAIQHFAKFAAGGLVVSARTPSGKEVRSQTTSAFNTAARAGVDALAEILFTRMGGGTTLARVQPLITGGLHITNTYRTPSHNAAVGGAPNSYHMDRLNPAVDIGGPVPQLDRLYRILRRMGGWRELLWRVAGHYDHIHVADTGGLLDPGHYGLNTGSRPERVLSASQTDLFERMVAALEGGSGGGTRTLLLVDADGQLIGRMRAEAGDVLDDELADARWGERM